MARFNAEKDESPKFPLRTFLPSDANARSHRFVLKVPGGGHRVNPA